MKKLFSLLVLALCLATPAMAAQLENVGPRGDKEHSGDLNARRYSRMYDRWKAEEAAQTQTAQVQQRYNNAPQTALLAQEDPAMPSMQPQTCNCNCNGQPVAAAPRAPVQQQSLQPLYNNQQAGNGMMPPVTITGSNY